MSEAILTALLREAEEWCDRAYGDDEEDYEDDYEEEEEDE